MTAWRRMRNTRIRTKSRMNIKLSIQFCLFVFRYDYTALQACLLGWICARSNETMWNKEYSHEGTTHQLKLSVRLYFSIS
jgi:hypothetical protein